MMRQWQVQQTKSVCAPAGWERKFTVPFDSFGGDKVPYIVTVKMVAVNANNKRSADGVASSSTTVGPVTKPASVSALLAAATETITVTVAFTLGDTTAIADRYAGLPGEVGHERTGCCLARPLLRHLGQPLSSNHK